MHILFLKILFILLFECTQSQLVQIHDVQLLFTSPNNADNSTKYNNYISYLERATVSKLELEPH